MQLLLLLLLTVVLLEAMATTTCRHNTTATSGSKPLYLLTLVPFTKHVGILSGARIARDEINNHTDLLPGYHIELIVERRESCSSVDSGIGLSNLLKHTAVSPPCRPVVAVMGLGCSSHTSVLSPVAGHDGYDLIQLSAANSPIFQTQNHRFPHLWTFLGSATVYSDTALALMEQFNWTRIGVVYNSGSVFTTENAKYFEQKIRAIRQTNVVFNIGISGTREIYIDYVISNIKSHGVTILIVMLAVEQDSILLSRVVQEGLVYPDYTWIHVEIVPQWLLKEQLISQTTIFRGIEGHIFLFPLAAKLNESVHLVSGNTYLELESKFSRDLEELTNIFNRTDLVLHVNFGSYLYNQLWAIALAVNNSLPVLENRNLSIDNYTIGQHEITDVIEEQMANLSFQGAGGWVEFNQYRSVSTPVEVFWILDNNGSVRQVGVYDPLQTKHSHFDINTHDLPKDRLAKEYALITLPVAILMYMLAVAIAVFTTVQLCLYIYLHCKNHKAIKATSPCLSLLMFAGCYLLTLASVARITNGSFFHVLDNQSFIVILCVNIMATLNGFSLILVTLCVKLLRVYRIFTSKLKLDLGRFWNSFPLFIIILCLTIFPNIVIAPLFAFRNSKYNTYTVSIQRNSRLISEVHIEMKTANYYAIGGFTIFYVTIFSLFILFLALRTRKIRYKNFKDTKKTNLFIAILLFTLALGEGLYIILLLQGNEPLAGIVMAVSLLVIVMASQVTLFLPKIVPPLLRKSFAELKTNLSTTTSFHNAQFTSKVVPESVT